MMEEHELLKVIRKEIVCKYVEQSNSIALDEVLSIACALVYLVKDSLCPTSEKGKIAKNGGSLLKIHKKVCSINNKNQTLFDTLRYVDLKSAIQSSIVSKIELPTQISLAEDLPLISINYNGFVSIRGGENTINTIIDADLPLLFVKEWDESRTIPVAIPNKSTPVKNESVQNITQEKSVNADKLEESELESFWKENINTGDFYTSVMPFVWKLKISESKYNKLKDLLIAEIKSIDDKKVILNKHSEKILVLSAEWYRREYKPGLNALNDVLGLDKKISAEDIFNKCPTHYSAYVYQGDNTSWLYSMYVLGGFPINYNNYNLDKFYDSIFDAIDGEEVDFSSIFNSARGGIAFRQSLMDSNGSLSNFIKASVSENSADIPFAEEDRSLEAVKSFVSRILEGSRIHSKKKFKLEWIVRVTSNSSRAARTLRVSLRPEELGERHTYINYDRVRSWGVENYEKIKNFWICLRFNNGDFIKLFKFSNRFTDRSFVAWTTSPYKIIDSSLIPTSYITSISLSMMYKCDGEDRNVVFSTMPIGSYLQLYPTNRYNEWSSAENKGSISAVIFRNDIKAEDKESDNITFGNDINADNYNFVRFTDKCVLATTNNKTITLYRKGDRIELIIKRYNSSIKYNHDGNLDYFYSVSESEDEYHQESLSVPVVFGLGGIMVVRHSFEVCSQPEELLKKQYVIKYKSFAQEENTGVLSEQNEPSQGLYYIKAETGNNEGTEYVLVYYIPISSSNNPIRRNLKEKIITFESSIKNVHLSGQETPLRNNKFKLEDPYKDFNNTIDFEVGDKEYLVVPVYRPEKRKLLLFNNKCISVRDWEDKFDVSLACIDRLSLILLDENGEHLMRPDNVGFYSFDSLTTKIEKDHVTYLKYHESDSDDIVHRKCSPKFQDRYIFYFWNYEKNKEEIRVEDVYDKQSQTKLLNIDALKKQYEDGIVFQSLENRDLTPPRYWEKYSWGRDIEPSRMTNEDLIKRFELAKKHNVYFGLFIDFDKAFIGKKKVFSDKLCNFFIQYCQYKDYNLSIEDYLAFQRFSDEFLFDWMFLYRYSWISATENEDSDIKKKCRNCVLQLLSHNPKLSRKSSFERLANKDMLKTFWSRLDNTHPINRNGIEKDAFNLLALNDPVSNRMFFTSETGGHTAQRRKEVFNNFLKKLYEDTNSYQLINEFLKK